MEAKLEWSGGREQSVEPSAVGRHADYEKAWWVLLGASLCIFSGSASVAYYTFGVFLPEIIAATKWSGKALAATIGPGLLAASVVLRKNSIWPSEIVGGHNCGMIMAW